jgi:small GTP-binding protein
MGGNNSKVVKYKVLLLGLDGAGKTTLLYKLRLKNANADFFATNAFNHEIITQEYNHVKYELHTWDLAGRKELRRCWKYFYNSMQIDIMIYVVSAKESHRLRESALNFKRLTHETSLLSTSRIVVINSFAIRGSERAYELTEAEVEHQFGYDCTVITINVRDPSVGMRRLFQWVSDQKKETN